MRCPVCATSDTQVKDSRQSLDGRSVKRRRFCQKCGSRFTTFERLQNREITIIKRDGSRSPFDREKLFKSISLATRKRSISPEVVDNIIDTIIARIEKSGEHEISSKEIGELVIKSLSELDDVAYVRFASVYHDFHNVSDFENFLSSIKKSETKVMSSQNH